MKNNSFKRFGSRLILLHFVFLQFITRNRITDIIHFIKGQICPLLTTIIIYKSCINLR